MWKEVKSIQVKGGPGKTKTIRDRVTPIALRYIQSDMPDVYEVQAARRAELNAAAAAATATRAVATAAAATRVETTPTHRGHLTLTLIPTLTLTFRPHLTLHPQP